MATRIPDNRARFTLGDIASVCAGELRGVDAAQQVVGVVTDSRRVAPGNLYVALRGEVHDGHRFASSAHEAGATAVLAARDADLDPAIPVVLVDDTLRALGDLAAEHRRRWGGRAVAITGSVGKTTTKELTYAALRAAGASVERTAGNLNNLVGLPMTLLALDGSTELAVLEIGTSAPGEIARLTEIAQPEVGVVTEVAIAHAEGLGTLEGVAREKSALLRALPEGATAIHNSDSEPLCAQLGEVQASRVSFGVGSGADVRLVEHRLTAMPSSRCEFTVRDGAETRRLNAELALFGSGPAQDAAAALAVVQAMLGTDALTAAAEGMATLEPTPGRLCPVESMAGALLIDDSYNANPASMRASIGTTCQLAEARSGHAHLVVADMLELGATTREEHEAVGQAAVAEPRIATLVACGTEMRAAADAARGGRDSLEVIALDDTEAAADAIAPRLSEADVVLVKGSRSMRTERVIAALASPGAEGGAP